MFGLEAAKVAGLGVSATAVEIITLGTMPG
jgi:hypothetical protein